MFLYDYIRDIHTQRRFSSEDAPTKMQEEEKKKNRNNFNKTIVLTYRILVFSA